MHIIKIKINRQHIIGIHLKSSHTIKLKYSQPLSYYFSTSQQLTLNAIKTSITRIY